MGYLQPETREYAFKLQNILIIINKSLSTKIRSKKTINPKRNV